MVFYHSTKFHGHRHCGSGDIVLVCLIILKDKVVKASCDFMDRSLSSYHLPCLMAIGFLVLKI